VGRKDHRDTRPVLSPVHPYRLERRPATLDEARRHFVDRAGDLQKITSI
jgi:hypothetical protein